MIIISEENWIEISRVFLNAFEQFWNKGTETQMIELNHRKIEISFFEQELCDPHRFNVVLFRPDVDKILEASFDQATHDTTEIIQMMYQLAWLTKQPYSFRITTNNCEEEYEQIREILFNVYYDCFEEFSIADPSEPYVLKHMIEIHDRKIFLDFTRSVMFDINGSINVSIHCDAISIICSCVVFPDDSVPDEMIRKIQNIAWLIKQPYSFQITTNNCEEEYEQIREILLNVYNGCYEEFSIADKNKLCGKTHIIVLRSKKIFLHFLRGEMFDINGSIKVSIHCFATNKKCSGVVCQDDPAPEEIIQIIRNLVSEDSKIIKRLSIINDDDMIQFDDFSKQVAWFANGSIVHRQNPKMFDTGIGAATLLYVQCGDARFQEDISRMFNCDDVYTWGSDFVLFYFEGELRAIGTYSPDRGAAWVEDEVEEMVKCFCAELTEVRKEIGYGNRHMPESEVRCVETNEAG